MDWHIGCSGFHYREWKGVFYPDGLAQRKWFDYYCQHFNTLELNVTFYRFPQPAFLKNWFDKSPDGFRFAVKAPRAITHYKQFNQCADLIGSFYETIREGLQHKLGPVLFQLPPSFSYTDERLERIIENLYPGFINVLEFRHPSWWNDEVYLQLAARHIIFSGISHPKLTNDNAIVNTDAAYYRFHGVPVLFSSSYADDFIKHIASQLKANPDLKQCWIYFNNTMHTAAIENAKTMLQLVTCADGQQLLV